MALTEIGEGLGAVALFVEREGDLQIADRQVALPARVAGVGFGEARYDGQAVAVGFQSLGQVALRFPNVANLLVRLREIALPARVAGVGGGEACRNFVRRMPV